MKHTVIVPQKIWEVEELRNKFTVVIRAGHDQRPGRWNRVELSISHIKSEYGNKILDTYFYKLLAKDYGFTFDPVTGYADL